MVPKEDQLEHAIKIFRIWPPLTILILFFITICLIFYSLPTEVLTFSLHTIHSFHSRSCWLKQSPKSRLLNLYSSCKSHSVQEALSRIFFSQACIRCSDVSNISYALSVRESPYCCRACNICSIIVECD